MSILVNKETRLVVQGITGREGSFHTKQMVAYGTKVVAGVTPGKAGETVEGVPVYNSVRDAVEKEGANASIIFVPPAFAADAALEAIDNGLELVVCITERIPVHEMLHVAAYARAKGSVLVGPNCPGLISPGEALVGILPGSIFTPGPVGLVSRSGTLTYEVVNELTEVGIGQSTCLGIGGDPIIGTRFIEALRMFEEDPQTKVVVMIGEIGGSDEEEAAEYIKEMKTPVVGFISGRTAPPGKRMGHAGALISGGADTADAKLEIMEACGIRTTRNPSEMGKLLKSVL